MQSQFGLPQSHFFRYLQVRHFVREHLPGFLIKPKSHKFHDILLSDPNSKHLISRFATAFKVPADSGHIRETWTRELGVMISEELWEESLSSIQYYSVNSRYQLIQFKVLHRLHYSKTKLSKIFGSVSPICDRCGVDEGSLSHLFWSCPVLNKFLSDIFQWFSSQYGLNIHPDCNLATLGCSDMTDTLPPHHRRALQAGMVAAKKLILLNWKSQIAPCFKRRLNEMLPMPRWNRFVSTKGNHFLKVWKPFLTTFNET